MSSASDGEDPQTQRQECYGLTVARARARSACFWQSSIICSGLAGGRLFVYTRVFNPCRAFLRGRMGNLTSGIFSGNGSQRTHPLSQTPRKKGGAPSGRAPAEVELAIHLKKTAPCMGRGLILGSAGGA